MQQQIRNGRKCFFYFWISSEVPLALGRRGHLGLHHGRRRSLASGRRPGSGWGFGQPPRRLPCSGLRRLCWPPRVPFEGFASKQPKNENSKIKCSGGHTNDPLLQSGRNLRRGQFMFTMQQLFYWWPLGSSFQAFLIAARLSSGALLLGQTEVLKVFTICDAGDLTLKFFGSSSSSRSPPPEDFPSAWSPPPRSAWRPHPPPPTPSRPSRPTGSMISCPRWGLATVYEKHSEQKA